MYVGNWENIEPTPFKLDIPKYNKMSEYQNKLLKPYLISHLTFKNKVSRKTQLITMIQ